MDEVASLRMLHGMVLSMGPITRRQTTTTMKKGDHCDGYDTCLSVELSPLSSVSTVFSAGTPTFLFSSCRRQRIRSE